LMKLLYSSCCELAIDDNVAVAVGELAAAIFRVEIRDVPP
jgi:hypothetical protein